MKLRCGIRKRDHFGEELSSYSPMFHQHKTCPFDGNCIKHCSSKSYTERECIKHFYQRKAVPK